MEQVSVKFSNMRKSRMPVMSVQRFRRCGYGFHEDGLKAGIAAAQGIGCKLPWEGSLIARSPRCHGIIPEASMPNAHQQEGGDDDSDYSVFSEAEMNLLVKRQHLTRLVI